MCKGAVWVIRIKVQIAQYNEFVKSGSKTRFNELNDLYNGLKVGSK